jgi:hypothetical protein
VAVSASRAQSSQLWRSGVRSSSASTPLPYAKSDAVANADN